jgi:hypothetical protein
MRKTLLTVLIAGVAFFSLAARADNIPAHLQLAEKMVSDIQPQNNEYKNGKATVTWAGINGAITENRSDCTTYVTALLKTAYHFTNADFAKLFGKSSPSISMYFAAATENKGLHGFKQISNLAPGDLLISKYIDPPAGSAAGQMMICDAPPKLAEKTSTGLQAYDITIIDCTGSPHANDTRTKPQSGIGRGTMQVYVDSSGSVTAWSWAAGNHMKEYPSDSRPMIFAKVPTR